MGKTTLTYFFWVTGAILWCATIFLRDMSINNAIVNFILGIMPNIGAAWVFIWLAECIFNAKKYGFVLK